MLAWIKWTDVASPWTIFPMDVNYLTVNKKTRSQT